MRIRAHVLVRGRVQGVFFRSRTQHEATINKVTGWVCNLPDERVEAVFEGEEENVKRLVQFCSKGPLGSKVTNIEVKWEPYSGEFRDFEIRY